MEDDFNYIGRDKTGTLYRAKLDEKGNVLKEEPFYVMAGLYPNGNVSQCIFNQNGEKIIEKILFQLTEAEKKSLQPKSLKYFDLNDRHVKFRTTYTKQGELPEVQLPDYPKNFDICNAEDYLQSFELKRIIINRWEKGQLEDAEDAVSEIYKQCLSNIKEDE